MHPWANMQPAKVDMVDEEKLTEGKTSFLFIFLFIFRCLHLVYTLLLGDELKNVIKLCSH